MKNLFRYTQLKESLLRYKRSQILEVYFARLDGRENTNPALRELYELSMEDLKLFLSGKFQQDPLIQQLSKMHSQVLESR
ncbi:MAG TPA: hypothetical protein VKY27_07775 [Bacteriovoracaceae bacterium]|nr:hypothetical protein [Bacteriovoracaceae bacterium]